jgi:SAM-dependent methyltransferase
MRTVYLEGVSRQKVGAIIYLEFPALLEVGGASGDIPVCVANVFGRQGVRLDFVVLDRSPVHLNGTERRAAGDALALPFADGSFDLVGSSLLVHHLEPGEVVRFINESLRVARVAALVNDLRRSPVHLALTYAGFALYRSRLTRHDAPASVRRAYTPEELRECLQATPAEAIEVRKHYLYRMGAIAWKVEAPCGRERSGSPQRKSRA